jgi:hypothetical protein
MVALGLLLLVAAGLVVLVGALGNSGADHLLVNGFEIFGYRLQGSAAGCSSTAPLSARSACSG